MQIWNSRNNQNKIFINYSNVSHALCVCVCVWSGVAWKCNGVVWCELCVCWWAAAAASRGQVSPGSQILSHTHTPVRPPFSRTQHLAPVRLTHPTAPQISVKHIEI